jgi:type II secretory pathway pseudopilin PulG
MTRDPGRFRSGGRDGLTLIEILLSIIVMALGLVGILALFPPAMQAANESMEETQAAILGGSVCQALVSAMRNAVADPQTGEVTVYLAHDLEAGSQKGRFEFVLPKSDPNAAGDNKWYHFPSAPMPPPRDPGAAVPTLGWDAAQDDRHFKLGANGWTRATTENVKQNYDDTDSLSQFQFSFNVTKVPTLNYLRKPNAVLDPNMPPLKPEQIDQMEKLYEFKIFILRVAQDLGGGQTYRTPIAVITKRIISK